MKNKELQSFIDKKINDLKIPYFNCIVKQKGKVIFSYSYAKEDQNNNLLNMYSMSKPITSCAILQLVEQGKIGLEDDVADYIPNFKKLKLINGEDVKKPITIHNLLTMTSGLDYNLQRNAIIELAKQNPNASTIDICSVLAEDGLLFVPGSQYQYSLSFDVLAAIIEIVTKQSYSSYVQQNIFNKLNMSQSTFRHDHSLAFKARKEYMANNGELKLVNTFYDVFFPTENFESGGAGLISTVEDYSKFIDSLANNKEAILKNSSVDLLSKIYVYDTPFDESAHQYSKSNVDYGYGYGVRVRKQDSIEGLPQGEFGWDGAAGSYSLCDRKNNVSIVMGMTIFEWPIYLKDFHIAIAKEIYKYLISNDK